MGGQGATARRGSGIREGFPVAREDGAEVAGRTQRSSSRARPETRPASATRVRKSAMTASWASS